MIPLRLVLWPGMEVADERLAGRLDFPSVDPAWVRLGAVKLVADGSIQGFTARLTWPFYFNPPAGNAENGLWLMPPDQVPDIVEIFHRAGLTVHCHCNGEIGRAHV